MSWSDEDFFPAFADAGMLADALHQPDAGPAVPFQAGFERPDELVLDGMVHSTDYSIEYLREAVVLKRGCVVHIGGAQYRVRQAPQAKGNGAYMVALLEKVEP